ncbi:MAG: winged helix-turn-helix transcriptional regulator [Calditrichia bacterium]|nr:winged helix-turn-helix transcriptional regulator [Calditrichia bacterium]
METMVNFFKSLGEETRLRIFNLLLHYNFLSVGDLEKMLKVSQTNVSRHLTVLRNGKLVLSRRSGNYMIYQRNTEISDNFIEEFKKMAEVHIQFKSDLKNAREILPF